MNYSIGRSFACKKAGAAGGGWEKLRGLIIMPIWHLLQSRMRIFGAISKRLVLGAPEKRRGRIRLSAGAKGNLKTAGLNSASLLCAIRNCAPSTWWRWR